MKRCFIIVLDSFGIGELPDAVEYGDSGSNTLASVRDSCSFNCPNLVNLGLFNIDGVGRNGVPSPLASYGRLRELSVGKDTTIGHWEIAGLISDTPFPTYPNGLPKDIICKFEKLADVKTICNLPYSGTEVIRDYGKEHLQTGSLIVYTSADSVIQIAAHEDRVSVEQLYKYCEIARKLLVGEHCVGRVIARPFNGQYPFQRTSKRHDFSFAPPQNTMLNLLQNAGYDTISVGKTIDIFAGSGISESYRTTNNKHGMETVFNLQDKPFNGLCFVNLADFDMLYGHRNDICGYAKALTEFDQLLKIFLSKMREEDILIITADHGCDPSTPSTNHSREYVPVIVYGNKIKPNVNLGTRIGFCDISATVLDFFSVDKENTFGDSFLSEIYSSF